MWGGGSRYFLAAGIVASPKKSIDNIGNRWTVKKMKNIAMREKYAKTFKMRKYLKKERNILT